MGYMTLPNKKFVLINCEKKTLGNYFGNFKVCEDEFSEIPEAYLVETYRISPQLMLDYLEKNQ